MSDRVQLVGSQLVLFALCQSLLLLVQRFRFYDHLLELVRWVTVQATFLTNSFITNKLAVTHKALPFLPRCMECRRGLAMRLPVRPFVCQTRVICNKTEESSVHIFIPYEKSFSLVSEKKNGWWGRTLLPEIVD